MMKQMMMAGMVVSGLLSGQALLAQEPATAHGHVQNAAGFPIKGALVEFTKNLSGTMKERVWLYKFPVDANGDYKGTDIAPGTYSSALFVDDKSIDIVDTVKFVAGENKLFDYDLTRKEYVDKMTPEEKAALVEYKKKTGDTMNSNKVIAGLNSTLATVRADLATAAPAHSDVTKDVDMMQQATSAKGDEGLLWITYGDTLQAQGAHLEQVDRDAKKQWRTDPDVTKTYSDGVDAYKKGIDLDAASKKPSPATQAVAYDRMGSILAKLGKPADAVDAGDKAAKLDPPAAAKYYGNEAANLFNNNDTTEMGAAAAKAIAADPNRPDPYFIEGQALIQQAKVVNGKMVAPPECIASYQKYLELDPNGKFSGQVKDILQEMGETVNTKYKAGKK